jgi:hypothetical protein
VVNHSDILSSILLTLFTGVQADERLYSTSWYIRVHDSNAFVDFVDRGSSRHGEAMISGD